MSFSLDSISQAKTVRAPRIILLGTEKVGKSTFASQSPSPIFLPIKGEEGIDDIEVPHFPTAKSFDDVIQMLAVLYTEKHDYQTVVIDSMSTLESLVWETVCKRERADSIEKVGGGYGKGYVEALHEWRKLMDGLDSLRNDRNIASVLIGHVQVKTFADPTSGSFDHYEFDINKKASSALAKWADSILFAHRKTYVQKEDAGFGKERKRGTGADERCLYTQKRPSHPGGGRGVYGRLPYELPLTWPAFQDAVAAASN